MLCKWLLGYNLIAYSFLLNETNADNFTSPLKRGAAIGTSLLIRSVIR